MNRRAFTLIELLVVVAIIALLISILLPSLARAREQTRDAVCRSNMRQVTLGFVLYAGEWRDCLPGGIHDEYVDGAGTRISLDWLGVNDTQQWHRAPHEGSIYRYVRNPKVYVCPTHRGRHEAESTSNFSIEHITSFTAPKVLVGAPIPLLKAARYPRAPIRGDVIPRRMHLTETMLPPIVVEEDTNHFLVEVKDSAWSNIDEITDRHRGCGSVGFVDGHAELRKFAKKPAPFTSWTLIYELTDGREVSAWHFYDTRPMTLGWIRGFRGDSIR